MHLHGASDSYLALRDMSGSSLMMSCHRLQLPSNEILTACCPETYLLKPQLQMGKVLA